MSSVDAAPSHSKPSWQNTPGDILVLIIKLLVFRPRESYLPLICTHVCSHWRRVVSGTPLLWSYIDVSRGDMLTQLWITNSAQAKIDVRLWEYPSASYGLSPIHPPSPRHPLALSLIQQTVDRWRSLDIAYTCLCRIISAVHIMQPYAAASELESLTIGPMGKAILHDDMRPSDLDLLPAILLSKLWVQPRILRIDTFTVYAPSPLFSSRLLELEVFCNTQVEVKAWHSILSSTPNLTSLKLWHTRSADYLFSSHNPSSLPTIHLDKLEHLSLFGVFTSLATLFSQSSIPTPSPSLPSLTSLRLSSSTHKVVSCYIGYLSAAAPLLSDLSVSFPCRRHHFDPWIEALPNLRSLDRLTFFEMDVYRVFRFLKAELHKFPKPLSYIGLERMGEPSDDEWSPLEMNGYRPALCIKDHPGAEGNSWKTWMRRGVEYGRDNAIIRAIESIESHPSGSWDESETDSSDEEDESSSRTPSEFSEDREEEQEEEDPGEGRVSTGERGGEDEDDKWSLASGDWEVINQTGPIEEPKPESDSDAEFEYEITSGLDVS
ncbi:hypothetical protein BDV93DRAFT_611123 [Ceratobasidium sp. AG-I]|nr:hypothetical protein BDV93DRAFT_611123 [Ceratobasidium sp. AG-I]